MLEFTLAYAETEETTADGINQNSCLLHTRSVHILPDMAVGCESCGNRRAEHNNHYRTERRNNADESNCSHIARAHKCDDNKCEEENKCSAEVLHKEKRADATDGEDDVFDNTLRGLQLVKRRRANENEGELDYFGGLNGKACNGDPVSCAVGRFSKQKVKSEQTDCGKSDGHTQLHNYIRTPKRYDKNDENTEAEKDCKHLLERIILINTCGNSQSDSREEESDDLKLKIILPAESRRNEKVHPFYKNVCGENGKKSQVDFIRDNDGICRNHLKNGDNHHYKAPVKPFVKSFATHGMPPFVQIDKYIITLKDM